MEPVRLLDLGTVPSLRSQTIYHAVGHAMTADTPDTIILVNPATPYVCIGFHQDLDKEVDVEQCRLRALPIYRREVGGGAVYLDDGQVFSQWAFHPDRLPAELSARFALYVRPLVETYQELGIEAYLRPINDIHVDQKKIGGTGAAQMGQAEIVVGSLMFTFDKKTMAHVLKVSSEKMRDKIVESLEQYMVTMQELLGSVPNRTRVIDLYVRKCSAVLGREITPGILSPREKEAAEEWDQRFLSSDWLYQRGGLRPGGVKIHEDVRVAESAYKAPGGLIRATIRVSNDVIDDVALSGDFTIFPATALSMLEDAVHGAKRGEEIVPLLRKIYRTAHIMSPGVTPEDFAEAITRTLKDIYQLNTTTEDHP
jgi:lipoate---protein ligase